MFEEDWIYGGNAWTNDYGKKEPDGKPRFNEKYGLETSYTGGEGWVAIASEPYTRRWMSGAGKDGLTEKSERSTRNVYARAEDVYGNGKPGEEEVAPEKEASPRDTGEYDDIIGSLQDDIKAANARADEFENREAEGITANRDQLDILNQNFQDQILALNEGVENRYAALEDMLGRQSASMQQQQVMMQQQMMAAQNSYNEQMRMMQNMQRASVPVAEQSAYTAQMGDQREDNSRRKEDNRLSDLSILSGLGTQGSPTAGLSLA